MRYRDILVGVNLRAIADSTTEELTPDTRQAVALATEVAQKSGARLTFAHVFAVSRGVREFFIDAGQEHRDLFASATEVMEGLVHDARGSGLAARSVFLHGKPWEELIVRAAEIHADLMVVGNRQPHGLRKALLGNTAHRVMLESHRPVLIANPASRVPCKRILIAADLTESGLLAIRHGLAHTALLDGQAELVHGVENWYEDRWHRAGLVRHIVEREHEEEKAKAHTDITARAAGIAEELGVPVPTLHVATGPAERVICDAAKARDADLVVMGVVGRSGLQRLFIGDTADRLLPDLKSSLLTVGPSISEPRVD